MATQLLLIVVILGLAAPGSAAERYQGRVIDAETKHPLQGAVVVVVWLTDALIHMDSAGYFHDAKEVLTDASGAFSIAATPAKNWNPSRIVRDEPDIVVFKPGYGEYPRMYSTVQWPNRKSIDAISEPLRHKQFAIVELPRLKTDAERGAFTIPHLHPRVPFGRIPNYIRLLNEHVRSLGLQPLPLR